MIKSPIPILLILLLLGSPQKEHIRKHVTNIFWYGLFFIMSFQRPKKERIGQKLDGLAQQKLIGNKKE